MNALKLPIDKNIYTCISYQLNCSFVRFEKHTWGMIAWFEIMRNNQYTRVSAIVSTPDTRIFSDNVHSFYR